MELLINNWGGGIGDDAYLSNPGEVYDMENIDVVNNTRFIKSSLSFNGADGTLLQTGNTMKNVNEINGLIVASMSGTDDFVYNSGTKTTTGYSSNFNITIGTALSNYDETTNPAGMRHFFIQGANSLAYSRYDGSSRTNLTTSLSDTRPCFAAQYLWKGAMIFASGNNIYEVNPSPNVPVFNGLKVSLQIGAVVRYIYYYNSLIWFVYTINGDTFIQGCQYSASISSSSSTYTLQNYVTHIKGHECISATGEAGIIYWVSQKGIHEFNGVTSRMVRRIIDEGAGANTIQSAVYGERVRFYDGMLRIPSRDTLWLYGSKKEGQKKRLSKVKCPTGYNIAGVTSSSIISVKTSDTTYRLDGVQAYYPPTSFAVTHPYTAGRFGTAKANTWLRVGYSIPKRLSGGTTLGSITVSCITDRIVWDDNGAEVYSSYVDIVTISDNTLNTFDITPTMVSSALNTAGVTDQYSWIKFRFTLTNGEQATGITQTLYRTSPEIWDIDLFHNDIKNGN